MNLIQVDGLRRPIGKKYPKPKPRPLSVEPVGSPTAAFAAAVARANGECVFVRNYARYDLERASMTAWAKTNPSWEVGSGYPEGKNFGRPSTWVRARAVK